MKEMNKLEMELIKKLTDKGIALQITLDIGKNPTVHAITEKGLVRMEGLTVLEALNKVENHVSLLVNVPKVEITKDMVYELRIKTNSGMMDCKKALERTNGDIDKAEIYLYEMKKSGKLCSI